MTKQLLIVGVAVLVVIGGVFLWQQKDEGSTSTATPVTTGVAVGGGSKSVAPADSEVVASHLEIPWEIAFLPDGTMLVTERPGRLVKAMPEKVVIPIEGVRHVGEGGLLGLAVHPDFSRNHFIYLYLTTTVGGGVTNRVERYRLEGNVLSERVVILPNIPGANNHDGGRIAFGPDGNLYITTGDAGNEQSAQDTASLAGKILRLDDDGGTARGNPFGNAVYSYGHRNPQGLAWDENGQLWATEHGRSGLASGFDELNRIEAGKNYGWPVIQGDETRPGMERPVIHSGARDTWAPASAAFVGKSIFFGGLRGEALYEAAVTGERVALTAHFEGQFGRIRAVTLGPDGFLYISTSNRDGRGTVQANDDKIIRVSLDQLQS